jgi:hypothetical protein
MNLCGCLCVFTSLKFNVFLHVPTLPCREAVQFALKAVMSLHFGNVTTRFYFSLKMLRQPKGRLQAGSSARCEIDGDLALLGKCLGLALAHWFQHNGIDSYASSVPCRTWLLFSHCHASSCTVTRCHSSAGSLLALSFSRLSLVLIFNHTWSVFVTLVLARLYSFAFFTLSRFVTCYDERSLLVFGCHVSRPCSCVFTRDHFSISFHISVSHFQLIIF